MKPLIGITSRSAENSLAGAPHLYGQWHTYPEAVTRAGGIPVYIPIFSDPGQTKELLSRLDGIIFSGGNDIGPRWYHQEVIHARSEDRERDKHEIELMRQTLEARTPLLAICRGMQLLNVVRGGTLYQDIAKEVPEALDHDGFPHKDAAEQTLHQLSVVPGTALSLILGAETIHSNSLHHQAVKDIGHGLTVNAMAADGIIEGLEDMSNSYVMAVQSHPEALAGEVGPEWRQLFDSFITAARESKSQTENTSLIVTRLSRTKR